MQGLGKFILLVTAIWLFSGAIWQKGAQAVSAPVVESLGQIKEGLRLPTDLAVDAEGNLYVADARAAQVVKFSKYLRKIAVFDTVPVAGTGIAVSPSGERIYVSTGSGVAILEGSEGLVQGYLGGTPDVFQRAYDLAYYEDPTGNDSIFVADSGTLTIKVYDAQGAFQYQFGGPGTDPGQFGMIAGIGIDAVADELYVSDPHAVGSTIKPKMHVFDLGGTFLRAIPAANGFGSGTIAFFGGIAFDENGRGYFFDAFSNNCRVLDLPNLYLTKWGSAGYEPGQLVSPSNSVYDSATGRLFVVCEGGRIEVFGIDGAENPIYVNHRPSVPMPLSPVGGSEVESQSPELVFANAEDADGDLLRYAVQVLRDNEVISELTGIAEGVDETRVTIPGPLVENATYAWRVQASDADVSSGWSSEEIFTVNAIEEAPGVPVLSAPLSGEKLDGAGQLEWQAATDPDPGDRVDYVLEISTDSEFSEAFEEGVGQVTEAVLENLANYAALESGQDYFWRISAVDNHDSTSAPSERGAFRYLTSVLSVTSNVPDANVYLDGNHAFPGRFVGTTPLEMAGLSPGVHAIVVERPGFEPFVSQVSMTEGYSNSVEAVMTPALESADYRVRPLLTGGDQLAGDAIPFVVDWDEDGLTDLLVGDASGRLALYLGVDRGHSGMFSLAAGVDLDLPLIPGAAPFVADWNNDGRKDLLVGGEDGSVQLFLNVGTQEAPVFDGGRLMAADGTPISVSRRAAPAVADIDGDGRKDLLVGSGIGHLAWFRNLGSDEIPLLTTGGPLITLSGPVVPCLVDWEADGDRDIIASFANTLLLYERQDDGTYVWNDRAEFPDLGSKKKGKGSTGFRTSDQKRKSVLGESLHIFALDVDGQGGKDLIIGNAAGEVLLASAAGSGLRASAIRGLLDKIEALRVEMADLAPEHVGVLTEIATALEGRDLESAAGLSVTLAGELEQGTELAKHFDELIGLLR